MDKKTKKLIVAIIVAVVAIVCAVLGVSIGIPLETLVPLGTEIIDGLASEDEQVATLPASFDEMNAYSQISPFIFA